MTAPLRFDDEGTLLPDPFRHPRLLRFVHRLVHRGRKDRACAVCVYVWRRFMAEPGVPERLAIGRAELEAGRGIPYEVVDGELRRVTP